MHETMQIERSRIIELNSGALRHYLGVELNVAMGLFGYALLSG